MARLSKVIVDKQEKLKELSEEDMKRLHRILNEYIYKNHKKNLSILAKRLNNKLNTDIPDDILEDTMQSIYIYMFLNPDVVFSFHSTDHLQRLVNTLIYHLSTLNNVCHKLTRTYKTYPIGNIMDNADDFVIDELFDEPASHNYVNEALDPHLSNEDRLALHSLALEDVKEYLMDNPNSKMNNALERTKTITSSSYAYDCALNYCATMSYKFLLKNSKVLGLKNLQNNLYAFKKILEEEYGRPVRKNNCVAWT